MADFSQNRTDLQLKTEIRTSQQTISSYQAFAGVVHFSMPLTTCAYLFTTNRKKQFSCLLFLKQVCYICIKTCMNVVIHYFHKGVGIVFFVLLIYLTVRLCVPLKLSRDIEDPRRYEQIVIVIDIPLLKCCFNGLFPLFLLSEYFFSQTYH